MDTGVPIAAHIPPLTSGHLSIVMGPMWSGKTSELLRLGRQCSLCEIDCLLVNHSSDLRYADTASQLTTHSGGVLPCTAAASLAELGPIVSLPAVILVNEAQFFPDIVSWTREAVEVHGKRVTLVGLDGDYLRSAFGDWLSLIPIADAVVKLRAICAGCKRAEAPFTWRSGRRDEGQVLVGTREYQALCRACYLAASGAGRK